MSKFALIGKRLDYSFSKAFFTDYFNENGLDSSYENIEITTIDEVKTYLHSGEFSGFNVTIPYKESIILFLDELSTEAAVIGAVNTISYKNGKLVGHNTDAFGFHQSIKPFLTNKHERALILGTGGASKAVAYVLQNIGIDVLYISRTPNGSKHFAYSEINKHMLSACKLVVNCTPVGTFPNVDETPEIPIQFLGSEHLVVDLIYNPEKTKLLLEAEKQGAAILNGYSMLKEQALKAWDIWNKGL